MKLNDKDVYFYPPNTLVGNFRSKQNYGSFGVYYAFDVCKILEKDIKLIKKASDKDIKNFLDKQLEAKLESIRRSAILLEIEEKVQAYQKQLMDEAGL